MPVPLAAYASNPYTAGYTDSTHNDEPWAILANFTYTGASTPNLDWGGVVSTAGWNNASGVNTVTGFVYQSPVTLKASTSDLIMNPQVWQFGDEKYSSYIGIGHQGSASGDVSFIYHYFYWNAARTQVSFYYESHYNNGTDSVPSAVYNATRHYDTSNSFQSGYHNTFTNSTTYKVKYLQFGIEAINGTVPSGTYSLKQENMSYEYGIDTIKRLATINATYTNGDDTNPTNDAYITWDTTNSSQGANFIGGKEWKSPACYHDYASCNIQPGKIIWKSSGTIAKEGTGLW